MNVQLFEQLCYQCCFQTQLEAKSQAEKQIYQIIEDIRNVDLLRQILECWTQTSTLFVISEYLVKIILSERSFKGFQITGQSENIAIISGSCMTQEELQINQQKYKLYEGLTQILTKQLGRTIENHVQNSVCNLIGLLVQQMLMMSGAGFEKYIKQLFEPFFTADYILIGLKLIQNTLQNIQMYNQYDSYISYRRIMFSFQGNDMLQFIQTLGQVLKAATPVLIKPTINCLREVMMFNFNVSYFELETDFDVNDQNNVNFPEKFAEYFSDPGLATILFEYVNQYADRDQAIALGALKCLKRMVSARKRVFTEKVKRKQFARDMFQGAKYLFENVTSNSEEIISDIMEFNLKLNLNFGLRQVRFEYQFCQAWLYSLQVYCIKVLSKQIKIKDNHIKALLELMKRICKYTNDFKLDNQLKISISKTLGEVGRAIIHQLLNGEQSFFSGFTPQSIYQIQLDFKKLKNGLKDFFESLFPILQIDLVSHLRMIQHSFNIQSAERFVIELSLISHIVINPLVIDKCPGQNSELSIEGQQLIQMIIRDILQFIKLQKIDQPLIQMSLMSLADNLLSYSLSEIDDGIGKQRNQKLFFQTFILPIQDQSNTTTQILMEYICSTLLIENKEIILYALSIIKEVIIRLKHHLFSDVFQQLGLITNIKHVLLNLKNSALQKPQFFSCRTQSAEILSILLLDNAYENYIQSILQLNDMLTLAPTQESIEIYLYEMLGYFRYVDVCKIFRLLIKQNLQKIQDLSSFILVNNPQQFELCKLCLKLMVAVTDNKALRFQYYSSSIVQIELVRSFQTILQKYCQHLLEAIKDEKVKHDYSERICRLIGLVFKIMHNILKGKYISQACQLLFGDRRYLELVIVVLELGSQTAQQMILYHKPCLQMVFVVQIICQTQLQLFELSPETLMKLLSVVETVQGHLLTQLYEEYRVQNIQQYQQPVEKTSLANTTDILQNVLEFISEEQQLAQLSVIQNFVQPMDQVIEGMLSIILNCILKGQCSTQTNSKLAIQVFAIMCTHQQTFVRVINNIFFSGSQTLSPQQWNLLTLDLDLRIKPQNIDQFRKNFNSLLQSLSMTNIEY